jgi:hypothetical protein
MIASVVFGALLIAAGIAAVWVIVMSMSDDEDDFENSRAREYDDWARLRLPDAARQTPEDLRSRS